MEFKEADRGTRMIYVKGVFVIFVFSVIVVTHVLGKMRNDAESLLRDEVLASIQHLGAEVSVVLDGRTISQPRDVILALSNLSAHKYHHSIPQDAFPVIISSGAETVRLELGRDAEIRDEYWVSVLDEESGTYRFIGSLRTHIFDQYPRAQ